MNMRRGESSYIGRDADGNPSGFARMRKVSAGDTVDRFPVECSHCSDEIGSQREMNRHMTREHPA